MVLRMNRRTGARPEAIRPRGGQRIECASDCASEPRGSLSPECVCDWSPSDVVSPMSDAIRKQCRGTRDAGRCFRRGGCREQARGGSVVAIGCASGSHDIGYTPGGISSALGGVGFTAWGDTLGRRVDAHDAGGAAAACYALANAGMGEGSNRRNARSVDRTSRTGLGRSRIGVRWSPISGRESRPVPGDGCVAARSRRAGTGSVESVTLGSVSTSGGGVRTPGACDPAGGSDDRT
jgi:hypothetical protein